MRSRAAGRPGARRIRRAFQHGVSGPRAGWAWLSAPRPATRAPALRSRSCRNVSRPSRHHEIEHDHAAARAPSAGAPRRPRRDGLRPPRTLRLEQAAERIPDVGIVVDHQHTARIIRRSAEVPGISTALGYCPSLVRASCTSVVRHSPEAMLKLKHAMTGVSVGTRTQCGRGMCGGGLAGGSVGRG